MVEYKELEEPYEFEERAGLFMAAAIIASKNYPDLIVDAENKTLIDLDNNEWAIKKSAQLNKVEMGHKAFLRGIEMDIKSTIEASVMVTIHGSEKKRAREFEKVVNALAKMFGGVRIDDRDTTFDTPEDENRFFTCLFYNFR